MSPRPYNSAKRRQAVEATRQRILDAATDLLAGPSPQLSIDAVAKQADVSRQTVYNAVGTRKALLEALCDHLGERGGMHQLAAVFTAPEAERLAGLISTFCHFWQADRLVTRRLRALATLDDDLHDVITARDDRRRLAITAVLKHPDERLVTVLWALTSFETYDAIATDHAEAVATLRHAAYRLAGVPGDRTAE
jgi:AcrR family transcriptional regulator